MNVSKQTLLWSDRSGTLTPPIRNSQGIYASAQLPRRACGKGLTDYEALFHTRFLLLTCLLFGSLACLLTPFTRLELAFINLQTQIYLVLSHSITLTVGSQFSVARTNRPYDLIRRGPQISDGYVLLGRVLAIFGERPRQNSSMSWTDACFSRTR